MAVLELRERLKGGQILDMQLVKNAYGKNKALDEQVQKSEILYLDPNKNRTNSWLHGIGLQLPPDTTNYGSMGSISYPNGFVKMEGVRYEDLLKNGQNAAPQTETEVFKRWFGDSQIANRDGTPKFAYHATNEDFWTFDRGRFGANTDKYATDEGMARTAHLGFWFSDHDVSKQIGAKKSMVVYLSIQNPYQTSLNELADMLENTTAEELVAQLKEDGYDGISVGDLEFGGTSYVAFDETQIKSATDNIGTFDGENPDIRYSLRDSEDRALTDQQAQRFANSKARDAKGRLLTLYHGTESTGFTVFEQRENKGYFFTDNRELATLYGGRAEQTFAPGKQSANPFEQAAMDAYASETNHTEAERGGVYEAYLNLENPLELDAQGAEWDNVRGMAKGDEGPVTRTTDEWVNYAYEQGYDGVIVRNVRDGSDAQGGVYVAFDAAQVKSVNNTEPTDAPDIRYSLKETDGMTWDEQVQRTLVDKSMSHSALLNAGNTGSVYTAFRVEDLPLGVKISDLQKMNRAPKGSRSAHNLQVDTIRAIPREIMKPVAAFHNNKAGCLYILTKLRDKSNHPVVVSLYYGQQIDKDKVNLIKSAYGMNDFLQYVIDHRENIQKGVIFNEKEFVSATSGSQVQYKAPLEANNEFHGVSITYAEEPVKFSLKDVTPIDTEAMNQESEQLRELDEKLRVQLAQAKGANVSREALQRMAGKLGRLCFSQKCDMIAKSSRPRA